MIEVILTDLGKQKIIDFYDQVQETWGPGVNSVSDLSTKQRRILLKEIIGDLLIDAELDFRRCGVKDE